MQTESWCAPINSVSDMVDRCKRFFERLRTSAKNDTGVKNGYQGKLLSMCEKYCFTETQSRMGHHNFEFNTPYIVPGWSVDRNEDLPADGFVILISTMNPTLNHARAQHWYDGNVTLTVDHTFKVLLSAALCCLPPLYFADQTTCCLADGQRRSPAYLHQRHRTGPKRTGLNVMGHTRQFVFLLDCAAQVLHVRGHTQQCFVLLVCTVHLFVCWDTHNINFLVLVCTIHLFVCWDTQLVNNIIFWYWSAQYNRSMSWATHTTFGEVCAGCH